MGIRRDRDDVTHTRSCEKDNIYTNERTYGPSREKDKKHSMESYAQRDSMLIPPFVVRSRSSALPPPLIVPRSELRLTSVVLTGKSVLIEPFVVDASTRADSDFGSETVILPFVASRRIALPGLT